MVFMSKNYDTDVVIIGAGPSGTVAACLLRQHGYRVQLLERGQFPRFVIGESLLPQCLQTLDKAGCLPAIEKTGFQRKVGATFQCRGDYRKIVFGDKFAAGPSYAYHVERSHFDSVLADCAVQQGADLQFGSTVTEVDAKFDDCRLRYQDADGNSHDLRSRFILDASGYGRVLPRLLQIDKPSELAPRGSLFAHVTDHIDPQQHSRAETLITTHPKNHQVWYWLISFANGRSSVGVVGSPEFLSPYQQQGLDGLQQLIGQDGELSKILGNAEFDSPHHILNAYSGNVSRFWGDGYAVLGNAGEFLDPVFSSGVTIGLYSSDLAVAALHRQLQGQACDWDEQFSKPLKVGIETFKCYVNGWYDGGFQEVIYSDKINAGIYAKIASVLAGYAWDNNNSLVEKPERRLAALVELCR